MNFTHVVLLGVAVILLVLVISGFVAMKSVGVAWFRSSYSEVSSVLSDTKEKYSGLDNKVLLGEELVQQFGVTCDELYWTVLTIEESNRAAINGLDELTFAVSGKEALSDVINFAVPSSEQYINPEGQFTVTLGDGTDAVSLDEDGDGSIDKVCLRAIARQIR